MKKTSFNQVSQVASAILLNIAALSILVVGWLAFAVDVDIGIIQWTVWLGIFLSFNLVLSCNLYSPIIIKSVYAVLLIVIVASYLKFTPYLVMEIHKWSVLYDVLWPLPSFVALIVLTVSEIKGRKKASSLPITVSGMFLGKDNWSKYSRRLGTMWLDVIICASVMLLTFFMKYKNTVSRIVILTLSLCVLTIRLIYIAKSAGNKEY